MTDLQRVFDLLCSLEWAYDRENDSIYCQECGNDRKEGHQTDCELATVMTLVEEGLSV